MSFKTDSDWAKNKDTPDIVYTFVDEEVRYRKENGKIYEITITHQRTRRVRELPTEEMTIEDFDAIKQFSDDSFQAEDDLDVQEHTLAPNFDDIKDTLLAAVPFETPAKPRPHPFYNPTTAKRVIEELKLTKKQRRRMELLSEGMSTWKIAEIENTSQRSVWESIECVKNKRKKFLKKNPRWAKYTSQNGRFSM